MLLLHFIDSAVKKRQKALPHPAFLMQDCGGRTSLPAAWLRFPFHSSAAGPSRSSVFSAYPAGTQARVPAAFPDPAHSVLPSLQLLHRPAQEAESRLIFRERFRRVEVRFKILFYNAHQLAVLKQVMASRIGHHHQVHIRIGNHILPQHAVVVKRALPASHPELIAVAVGTHHLRCLRAGLTGCFHPFSRNELPPVPAALLQIKHTELCGVLRAEEQPPAALGDSHGTGLPENPRNSQRLPQPRPQILHQRLPGQFRHNGGQHVGIHAVIFEILSRRTGKPCLQETVHPVVPGDDPRFPEPHAAGHGEQMLHRNLSHAKKVQRVLFSEKVDHPVR